jgi:hypothetical protein
MSIQILGITPSRVDNIIPGFAQEQDGEFIIKILKTIIAIEF